MISRRRRTHALACGLTACSSLLLPLAVAAAPWYLEPTVSLYTTYQSNPQFYVNEPHSGSGEIATFDLPFEWSDGRANANLHPSVNAGTTQGATGLGQHNRSLDGQWNWGYDHGSLRASGNVAHLDLFGTPNADLGLVRPVGYTASESYGAGTTYTPDERSTIDLDAQRQISDFKVSGPSAYVNYMYSQLVGQYSYATTERTQAILSASYGDYSPDQGDLGSRDHSLQVGGAHLFTDNIKLSATIGRSRVKFTRDGSFHSGNVYNATLTWNRPTTNFQLVAKQSQQPGAIGDLTLTTNFIANFTWQRSERLSYALAANYSKLSDTFVGLALSSRNYLSLDASLHYFFTPQWRLDARVNKARTELPDTIYQHGNASATSNGGSIGISRVFGRTRLN